MSSAAPYRVLLYYRYVRVPDPAAERDAHEAACAEIGLKGRILIAPEGLNGTVCGSPEQTEAYKRYIGAHALFHATEFKEEGFEQPTFHKLHVRVKEEIVHFGLPDLETTKPLNNYVEPEEFREILNHPPEDAVIFDARSNYETRVGRFKGAIAFDIENFRDLPQKLEELKQYRHKTIYTYCTGGIKCEKVSAWLQKEGFEKVYQLHGGIIRYAAEAEGENFEGSCYVFDQRVVVPVNKVNPTVIGECEVCSGATEKMVNCANPECNKHFLICDACASHLEGCCSEACRDHPRRRKFDGRGYYLRGVNSKLYVQNPDPNYLKLASQPENGMK